MIFRNIITGALMLALSAPLTAALVRVTVAGRPYYQYEVKKGETMFGICREMGWDINVLRATNPGESTALRKGRIIYYPCETAKDTAPGQPAQHNGGEIRHKIARGETLSSISRMYGVPVSQLEALNPGSSRGIRADEWLVVSVAGTLAQGEAAYHTILKGETIYGLARSARISVHALLAANPGLSEATFRAGDVIRVPGAGTGVKLEKRSVVRETVTGFTNYKVGKNDTWASVASGFGVSEEDLRAANKGVEFKPKRSIGVPVVEKTVEEVEVAATDPREENARGIEDIYREVHGMADTTAAPQVRMAVVSDDPTSRRDRQFLRGVLLGVGSLKNSGTRIALKVLDGRMGAESNGCALDNFRPTVIVTTAEKNIPAWLGIYAAGKSVPLVNTLDVHDKSYETNPYMVQLITPSEHFNDETAAWLKRRYDGYSLVFTGDEDPDDSLADALKGIWEPGMVRTRSVEDLRTMPLNERGKYLLYSYPVKKNEISEFLDAVNEATLKTPLATVAVVGRPNWIVYDESLGSKFHRSDVLVPARFYMDKGERGNSGFAMAYRQMFDAPVENTFPVYSAMGYDVTRYFISGLAGSEGDLNGIPASDDMLQSDFMLQRPTNWSGPVNKAAYMVRFTPFDTVEKIVVK